jgi:hypothetical protein
VGIQIDIPKLIEGGYSTKRSTPIQVCLCRRCYWAAKMVEDSGRVEQLQGQDERNRLAYMGRIACLWQAPNHSRIRDCDKFLQTLESLPLVEDEEEGAKGADA